MDLSIKKAVINVIREEGGINCTITIVRKSAIEGTRTIAEHSQQHRSGLRELSEMSNKRIEDGHHRNSLVYNRFSAVAAAEDRMNWKFPSDVITQDKKSFRKINYLVKIENLYMG
ncbi:MAG: hypothetical protein COY80_00230 [Candidatus Pacebacteria bacterium CG_4_10_14_0_8_um_filter_42_14]|nr:MAG: hypothetical protein COY80_00230 [Candidatus Pacebacteria bacterium CG_4_10_14_0_8_um_filter_42_14]